MISDANPKLTRLSTLVNLSNLVTAYSENAKETRYVVYPQDFYYFSHARNRSKERIDQ